MRMRKNALVCVWGSGHSDLVKIIEHSMNFLLLL